MFIPSRNRNAIRCHSSDGLFANIARMEEILATSLNESDAKKPNTLLAPDFLLYSDVAGLVTRSDVLGKGQVDLRSLGVYDRMRYRSCLTVLPLPDFGALARGSHSFADRASETQNFTHIRVKQGDHWRLAKAIGHG